MNYRITTSSYFNVTAKKLAKKNPTTVFNVTDKNDDTNNKWHHRFFRYPQYPVSYLHLFVSYLQ